MAEKFSGPLPELVPEKLSPEEAETKQEKEKRVRRELVEKGKQSENVEFEFIEPKRRIGRESLPAKLDWSLFNANLSEKEKEDIGNFFERMKDFLDAPIITDNIPDHPQRRVWEGKYLGQLSPEARDYYSKNRLGFNFYGTVINFQKYFDPEVLVEGEEMRMDQEAYDHLVAFCSIIPRPLTDLRLYDLLSKEQKVECVEKLAPIVSAVVRYFGERKTATKN